MAAIKTLFNLRWLALIVALAFFVNVDKAAAQAVLYGAAHTANTGDSVLYRIDPSTGEATEVGPIGFQGCSGMDFDSSWTLYATCTRADGTHVLITIDQETGSGIEVGPTGIQLLGSELQIGTDISFRNSDGTLFAYVLGLPDYLGTIDTSSGLVSEIGKVNFLELGNGIAFSPDGKLFHAGSRNSFTSAGKLRTLEQEPNAEGNIGVVSATPLKFPSNTPALINAMEFEPRTGILFVSLSYGGAESFLAIVNIKKGAVTVIGQTQDNMDAIAFVPVITEAASTTPTGAPYLKCNKVARGRYIRRHEEVEVMLENSSGSVKVRVLKPKSLCTVLYDDGGVLTESTTSLTCYRVKDVVRHRRNGHHLSFEWHHVYIDNEFGEQTLSVNQHQTLCVPSEIKDDKVKIKTHYHKRHRHSKYHKKHRRTKKHKRDDDDDDD